MGNEIKTTSGIILTTKEIVRLASESNILMQRMLNDNVSQHIDGKFNSELNFPMFSATEVTICDARYHIDGKYFLKYSFNDHCIKAIVGKAHINLVMYPNKEDIHLISVSSSVKPDEPICYIGNEIQEKVVTKLTENYYEGYKKKKDK